MIISNVNLIIYLKNEKCSRITNSPGSYFPGMMYLTNVTRDMPPTLLSGIQSLAIVAGQSVVPDEPAAIVLSVWKEFVSVEAW